QPSDHSCFDRCRVDNQVEGAVIPGVVPEVQLNLDGRAGKQRANFLGLDVRGGESEIASDLRERKIIYPKARAIEHDFPFDQWQRSGRSAHRHVKISPTRYLLDGRDNPCGLRQQKSLRQLLAQLCQIHLSSRGKLERSLASCEEPIAAVDIRQPALPVVTADAREGDQAPIQSNASLNPAQRQVAAGKIRSDIMQLGVKPNVLVKTRLGHLADL